MKKLYYLLLTLLFTIFSFNIFGQGWTQIGGDIDGEAEGDMSGSSISLNADGTIVAIGTQYNDGNGTDAGHVRIYQNVDGDWVQMGEDIDGEEGDNSGISVSLSADGSVVIIGSPRNDVNGSDSGKVRIYENKEGSWINIGEIDGEATGDCIGFSVDISSDGSIIALGSHENDSGGPNYGRVRVFKNNEGTWEQFGDDILGNSYNEQFGREVRLSSDGYVVAIKSGTISVLRIYKNVDGVWTQIGDDLEQAHSDIRINNDGSVIAFSDKGWFGKVRVFENKNGSWIQKGEDIGGWFTSTGFGERICLSSSGDLIVIPAIGDNYGTGLVRIYEFIDNAWAQVGDDIKGEAASDNFGYSVSISSDESVLAVSASRNDGNGTDAGNVRIFKKGTLALDDISASKIKLYPNPSQGIFTIENAKGCVILISDVSGKLIYKSEITSNPERIVVKSKFKKGLYFIRLESETINYTRRLVID
ncbi:MAG: T9SS type A sorting domain-containing protein [Bacteroidota bacterium]